MPRRKRTIRAKSGRKFSPELEAFLTGDNLAFSDIELENLICAERYFVGDIEASMSAQELARFTILREAHEQRLSASETAHYRKLAEENGFLERWQAFRESGESASIAFLLAQTEYFREYGKACRIVINPEARPN
ncbi:MAG: hypothetical protein ABSC64_20260 [Candidatus Korobacteraceae bacterium]|jgi:hypothetical protein